MRKIRCNGYLLYRRFRGKLRVKKDKRSPLPMICDIEYIEGETDVLFRVHAEIHNEWMTINGVRYDNRQAEFCIVYKESTGEFHIE